MPADSPSPGSVISSRSVKASATTRRRLDCPSKKTAGSTGEPLHAEIETVGQPLAKRTDRVAGRGDIRGATDVDNDAGFDDPPPDPLQGVDARQNAQGDEQDEI